MQLSAPNNKHLSGGGRCSVTSAVVSFDDAPEALVDPPTKLVLVP